MRHFFLASLFLFLGACSTHHSGITAQPVALENTAIYKDKLPIAQTGCGWVVVNETSVTKFIGLTIDSYVRQFDDALFYCCPGETMPDPVCHQARWRER